MFWLTNRVALSGAAKLSRCVMWLVRKIIVRENEIIIAAIFFIKKHIIAKYTGCTIIFKKPIKLIGFFYHKHNRNQEIKKPVLCWKKIGSFIYVLFRGSILYAGTLLFDAYALIPWFHFWRGYALITATLLFYRREYIVSSRILQETLNGMCEIPLSRCHLQIVLQNITKHNNKKKIHTKYF